MAQVVEMTGDVAVVMLSGNTLEAGNETDFKQEVRPVLESNTKVVFDMGRLRFVDSCGLRAILLCLRQLKASGGDLKLCQLTKPVRTLFELVRFHRVFDIYETRDQAVRAFQR